jgi:hypothetical protein
LVDGRVDARTSTGQLPDALVVPMGAAVAVALRELGIEQWRCLYGFPHPGRAYPFGDSDFEIARPRMRRVVARLTWC